jgi:hypothetical protein
MFRDMEVAYLPVLKVHVESSSKPSISLVQVTLEAGTTKNREGDWIWMVV